MTNLRKAPGLLSELKLQLSSYAQVMRLHKPIGIWLLLWPTLWGLWLAAAGQPDPWVFTVFVLGVVIMRSAGCVINDFADRKLDGQVARTRGRPLATGQVAPAEALVLFIALSMIALGLVLTLDRLTQLYAVGAAVLTVIYPFCKRLIAAPQVVLGAAFGMGIPMAFAAQTGGVPRLAWLLWLAVVVWAVVYDTMYAMADREDDLKVGIKSTAILFGQADVFIIGVLQVVLLIALWLAGEVAALGLWYRLSLLVCALLMLYQHTLIRTRQPADCMRAFLNNQYVGGSVFAGIALSYVFAVPPA
jgi:4-hydroxybenzoate polyprenyltransferase